jgi:hypothetical protein
MESALQGAAECDRQDASPGSGGAARFRLGEDRHVMARVWTRGEWDALPVASRPDGAQPTRDGRHWIALDVTAE